MGLEWWRDACESESESEKLESGGLSDNLPQANVDLGWLTGTSNDGCMLGTSSNRR